MRHTIRFRITVVAVVLCAALLIGLSLLVVVLLRSQLTDNVDESLRQRADTIAAALVSVDLTTIAGDEDLLVQLVRSNGSIDASTNLRGFAPIAKPDPGVRTVHDIAGRTERFRLLTRNVTTVEGPATLHVGINFDDVTDPVSIVARLLTAIVPAAVTVLGALIWWLTGRTLRPVDEIRREMATITATNLDRRVPETRTGDEIDRLAQTMNATLDRLEAAVRRQNRFVSDASHELRGPLTRIRGELEVDAARVDAADLVATHASVLEETIGLQHLVDDLLHLARSDGGASELSVEPLDLDDIVLRETRQMRERGRVVVDTGAVSAAHVVGDGRQLKRAITNLLDNAERHARSVVTVTLAEVNGFARLTVADDGPGVPPSERERVFERFTRLDDARTRDAGGSGLGLAIARDVAVRHDGTLVIDSVGRLVMQLPLTSAR